MQLLEVPAPLFPAGQPRECRPDNALTREPKRGADATASLGQAYFPAAMKGRCEPRQVPLCWRPQLETPLPAIS